MAYRNEVEALRARIQTLEGELADAKEQNQQLRQTLQGELAAAKEENQRLRDELAGRKRPAEVKEPVPPAPEIAVLTRRAYRAAWLVVGVTLFAAVWAGLGALSWLAPLTSVASRDALSFGLLIVIVVLALIGFYFAGKPIKARTEYAGEMMLFITWFWVPFCVLFPVIGFVIAVWRAVILFRGKLSGGTITSGSSSSYYEPKRLGGEGVPAGMIFLCLAALQPIAWLASKF